MIFFSLSIRLLTGDFGTGRLLCPCFLSKTVKVTCGNWTATSKDQLRESGRGNLRLHKELFTCLFKVQWSSTQHADPGTGESVVAGVVVNVSVCERDWQWTLVACLFKDYLYRTYPNCTKFVTIHKTKCEADNIMVLRKWKPGLVYVWQTF